MTGAPIEMGRSPDDEGEARSAEVADRTRPRVGVVSAWFDPEDPRVWSGVPHALVAELRRLGVYAGPRDATPVPALSRVVHRWATLTGREDGWARRAEMRVVTRLSDVLFRLRTPRTVDGWVQLLGANGRVVSGRYVTAYDMAPSQLLAAGPDLAGSFGFPHATRRQLEWVARAQVRAIAGAHACCVASRWAADALVRDHAIDARRVHVVGYGRNASFPVPPERDWTTPRFLFVGRDWRRKNGAAVVRAFRRLRGEVPDARLDVVGEHPTLSIEGVTGHGPISVHTTDGRRQIKALFGAATCFVVPSIVEPFGIVYVEAAAAGIASIGTSVGGTTDSIGDGGLRVDPHDDDAIFEAMRALSDPDTARALGTVACKRSSDYTWTAFGQRVLRSLDLGAIPGIQLAKPL